MGLKNVRRLSIKEINYGLSLAPRCGIEENAT